MEAIEFIQNFPIKRFTKGEILLREGETSDTLLAVRSGYIKVTSISDAGVERLLWIAGRYDMAPTEQLFSVRGPLQFFYTALSDGEVYQINKAKFLTYAKQTPALMTEIATSMSNHYDDLLNRIDSIEQTTVRDKLIQTLCYLAARFSADDSVDIHALGLRLTHNDIADMIGSTRETTSLELAKLRDENGISYDRTHFVINMQRLQSLRLVS
jgi:CRP/FNR family transcriptional regulator, cyclic AMP receptor protein